MTGTKCERHRKKEKKRAEGKRDTSLIWREEYYI
jgi:hypothetical protein